MPQRYVFDPESGMLRLVSGDTLGPPVDPTEVLYGRFDIRWSGQTPVLLDLENPFNPISLGRQGEIGINVLDNGVIDILSEVSLSTLNSTGNRQAIYAITGSVSVMGADGNMVDIEISRTNVSGYNQRAYAYIDTNDEQHYVSLRPDSPLYNEYVYQYGELRPLSAREARDRAIIDYLSKYQIGQINRLMAAGLEDQNGIVQNSFSGVVTALANMYGDDFTYNKWTRLTPDGIYGGIF